MQQVFHDGSLSLHTRSLKYGKVKILLNIVPLLQYYTLAPLQLTEGCLICVSPALVKRCKNHFHNLLCGVSIILGNNGYIWISKQSASHHQQVPSGGVNSLQEVTSECDDPRLAIARLRNCISALALNNIMIFDTTIQYTYEASLKFEVSVYDIKTCFLFTHKIAG